MKLKIGMLDHMNNTFLNTAFQISVGVPLHLFNDLSDAILTDKTLESKSQEDEDNENGNENVNENEDDDKTMSQNKIIKKTNDVLDEIIDKSKSFEEQIKLLKKKKRSKKVSVFQRLW